MMAKKSAPVDKTKVDPTDAVREAGTDVYETRSGLRLPDGTLVNYDEEDDDATGSATVGVAREFDGTDFEVADDQLADVVGNTSSDDASDPLTSFLGAAEGKLGRDTNVVTSDDQTNTNPVDAKPSVADDDPDDAYLSAGTSYETADDDGQSSDDPDDRTTTYVNSDGETEGEESDGTSHYVEDPGSDGEGSAPIPADLQAQLDSDLARFGAARPQTGDGVTDPSEIESEAVGPAGALIRHSEHSEHGESLFGQPGADADAPSGPSSNVNPGSNSHGAGAITPGEDQDGGGSFLPPSEDASEVEPGDAIPDAPEPSG